MKKEPISSEEILPPSKYLKNWGIIIKRPKEIDAIRKACRLTSDILVKTCRKAKAGVTTLELNDYAHALMEASGAIPATLNYGHPPYPASICTSINDVICHGIPDKTELKNGDIINIDVSLILDGYFGDCSAMVKIGTVDPIKKKIIDVAYDGMMRAIKAVKPGLLLSKIGDIVESYAEKHKFTVADEFAGHGVGIKFHEPPDVFCSRNDLDIPLSPGMIFTIEPMVNAGKAKAVISKKDGWTARTRDGLPSAQWEHTILVTNDGHEILTNWTRRKIQS